jgi:IS1 family transposase
MAKTPKSVASAVFLVLLESSSVHQALFSCLKRLSLNTDNVCLFVHALRGRTTLPLRRLITSSNVFCRLSLLFNNENHRHHLR